MVDKLQRGGVWAAVVGVVGAAFGTFFVVYEVASEWALRTMAGTLVPYEADPSTLAWGAAVIVASVLWLALLMTRRR